MTRIVTFAGWIVAAAAIVAALTLNAQVGRLKGEVKRLESSLESREKQMAQLAALSQAGAESRDQAERQEELSDLEPTAETAVVEPAPPDVQADAEAETASGDSDGSEAAETGEDSDAEGADQTRQEKVVNAQLDMLMGMAYAKLFADLNLPADVENQVRDLLVQRASETRGVVMAAMQAGDTPAKDVKRQDDEATKRLREELGRALNAQELAAWDTYEEYADQYLYENLLDGQLGMLAPGLSSESRQVTKDVFAEELVAHLDAFEASDTVYTLANFNAAQSAALHQGLARLAETMDAEQYTHAEAFVQQCDAMFGAMAE